MPPPRGTQTVMQKPIQPSLRKRVLNKIGVNVNTKVTIYNHSDVTAYIVLSDTPIHHVNGIAVDRVSVNRELVGHYKDQRSFLSAGADRPFELFSSTVYYSIYFKLADGTEKVHTRDKLHNALKNDINILQRHVIEAQPGSIPL